MAVAVCEEMSDSVGKTFLTATVSGVTVMIMLISVIVMPVVVAITVHTSGTLSLTAQGEKSPTGRKKPQRRRTPES
jgi:hypothetical protein